MRLSTLKEMAKEYRDAISLLRDKQKELKATNPVLWNQMKRIIVDLEKTALYLENCYESWCPSFETIIQQSFGLAEFRKLAKSGGGKFKKRGGYRSYENRCKNYSRIGQDIDGKAAGNILDALLREYDSDRDCIKDRRL